MALCPQSHVAGVLHKMGMGGHSAIQTWALPEMGRLMISLLVSLGKWAWGTSHAWKYIYGGSRVGREAVMWQVSKFRIAECPDVLSLYMQKQNIGNMRLLYLCDAGAVVIKQKFVMPLRAFQHDWYYQPIIYWPTSHTGTQQDRYWSMPYTCSG